MAALADIQAILKYDNLDNPLFGIKAQLEAWEAELSAQSPGYTIAFTKHEHTVGSTLVGIAAPFPMSIPHADADGFSVLATTAPFKADSGVVVSGLAAQVADLFTIEDGWDLVATLEVVDMTSTNKIIITRDADADIGQDSISIDWSGAATLTIGTDLTYGAGGVSSTAGGVFIASMFFNGGWD